MNHFLWEYCVHDVSFEDITEPWGHVGSHVGHEASESRDGLDRNHTHLDVGWPNAKNPQGLPQSGRHWKKKLLTTGKKIKVHPYSPHWKKNLRHWKKKTLKNLYFEPFYGWNLLFLEDLQGFET